MDSLDLYCAYKPLKKYAEKGPSDYKPFTFGNQCYVMSEQIIRHVQESLSLSIGMLTPSGEIMLINPTQHSTLFTVLLNHVLNQRANEVAMPTTPAATPATRPSEPIPNSSMNNFQGFVNLNRSNMKVTQTNWDSSAAESDMQIPSCSKSTSCSELSTNSVRNSFIRNYEKQRNMNTTNEHVCDNSHVPNTDQCPFCCKLSARQQQKLRKILFENDFPNEKDATTWCNIESSLH